MTKIEIERALQLATSQQLAAALASHRLVSCDCGDCPTCRQRKYRQKRRLEGKDKSQTTTLQKDRP